MKPRVHHLAYLLPQDGVHASLEATWLEVL